MVRRAARLVRNFGILVLFLLAALAGTASGVIFASVDDLPQIAALDDYSFGQFTKVLGNDGSVVAEYTYEGSRRRVVTFEQIPDVLKQAILSSEDADFYHHGGLNLQRIAITAVKRVLHLQRFGGASTITQQLARDLFLTKEYSWERKIKEALLALQIEKRYTKNEIFTLFCNKMYWGDHAYGVEAVSQLLFAKHVEDLNLDEAALIAGMLQLNAKQSPYHNLDAATARRNTVLGRMAEEGYITKAVADAAKKRPIVTYGQLKKDPSIAPYFKETLRVELEDHYGQKAIDAGGMVVRTGLDPALQRAANAALDKQLRILDKQHGYRPKSPKDNIEKAGKSVDSYTNEQWTHDPVPGEIVPAIVMSVEGKILRVRVGRWHGTIDAEGYAWTHKTVATDIARRGDVVDVKFDKVDAKATTFTAALDQEPTLEGAVVAIDNHSGQVRAMIGGRHFSASDMFNRAMLAKRQVGSLFKPFVFTAAIDSGMTANDTIEDKQYEYLPGPNQPIYSPKNYEEEHFDAPMTLRQVLEHSANRPTVQLMYLLTPEKVIPYARALGVTTAIPPFLSTAIGSAEGLLIEMTSAYSAFPNQGVRMEPILFMNVTDREGNVLEENYPEPHEGIKADTAAVMTSMLQGVIDNGGTAQTVRSAGNPNYIPDWPLGGKTGTTDDSTDAWFIGFDPDITIGVWVGYNAKKSIGEHATGAVAALPIWAEIMRSWVDRQRAKLPEKPVFLRPGNVIDYVLPNGKTETFIAGTAPGKPVIAKDK